MSLRGVTVLLVEDDPESRATTCAMLSRLGARVLEAENGDAALRQLERSGAPDVIVCDLDMPGMGGFELAERARADPRWAAARLIALTAADQPGAVRRAWELGFAAYVVKPATMVTLALLGPLGEVLEEEACPRCSKPIGPGDRYLTRGGERMHLLCASRASVMSALEECDRAAASRRDAGRARQDSRERRARRRADPADPGSSS
jgi:CheY-like chemotaxis protein